MPQRSRDASDAIFDEFLRERKYIMKSFAAEFYTISLHFYAAASSPSLPPI